LAYTARSDPGRHSGDGSGGRRVAAVYFYLKTQAKDRGYVERSEVQHGSEARQRVIEEVIDAADDGNACPIAPGTVGMPQR
jgi:hypothetical protein